MQGGRAGRAPRLSSTSISRRRRDLHGRVRVRGRPPSSFDDWLTRESAQGLLPVASGCNLTGHPPARTGNIVITRFWSSLSTTTRTRSRLPAILMRSPPGRRRTPTCCSPSGPSGWRTRAATARRPWSGTTAAASGSSPSAACSTTSRGDLSALRPGRQGVPNAPGGGSASCRAAIRAAVSPRRVTRAPTAPTVSVDMPPVGYGSRCGPTSSSPVGSRACVPDQARRSSLRVARLPQRAAPGGLPELPPRLVGLGRHRAL